MLPTILAFDTSSTACSVAIQKGKETKGLHKIAPMQQAKLILPMIQELLTDLSLSFSDLDAIAFGAGPGSFTGIRIASSVAQGIAFAAQKPVISVSSLAVLAQSAYLEHECSRMLVAVDARMDQVYFAEYEIGQSGIVELIGEEKLCYPADLVINKTDEWCGVGDGFAKLSIQPANIYSTVSHQALALLPLALKKFEKSQCVAAAAALPSYLRRDENGWN